MNLTQHELGIVKKILASLLKDCRVLAFGSRVSGNATRFSDLDLALIGEKEIPSSVISSLKEAFSESNLPFMVDVIDWSKTSEKFRNIILENSEQIYPD